MADSGATTTGSIDAKITADIAALLVKIQEAKAAVGDLTATDPDIKVDANVGEAIAKLSAVEAAQRKLGVSADALKLAYARLKDAQEQGGVSETRMMALRLAATKAENVYTDAVRALTAAREKETAIAEKSNETTKTGASRMALIAGAVAALIPLIGPLAGYMYAVAAAAGVMGAAGVAAVIGIRNEMAAGTRVGDTYAAGLQTLKQGMAGVASTGATAMLGQFRTALDQINSSLPQLNSQVQVFSNMLGQGGNLILQSLVRGLQIANPLLIQAGVYINQLAAGFLRWTTSGSGFQSFVQYAQTALPRVAAALGQLAMLILNVVQATAPLGSVVLTVLTALVGVINAIPVQVLQTLTTVLATAYAGFMVWKTVPTVLEAVRVGMLALGIASSTALGPIGILIQTVATIAAVVGIAAITMQDTANATRDYTIAVQQDNGVLAENVRLQAAKNLQTSGALKNARDLGVSTDQLVKAALGEGDAYQKVTAQLKAKLDAMRQTTVTMPSGAKVMRDTGWAAYELAQKVADTKKALDDQRTALRAGVTAYNELQTATGGATISTAAQLQAVRDLAGSYGVSVSAYANATAAQRTAADQLAQTTLKMQLQNDAAGLLKQSLDLLNGKTLGVAQAQTGFAAAQNSLTDALRTNGRVVDGGTKSAVANQQAIQQAILSAQNYAAAVGKQTGRTADATAALAASKQQMLTNLGAQGLLTDSLRAYIDRLFQIPTTKSTKVELDTAAAQAKLAALQAAVAQFNAGTAAKIAAGVTSAPGGVLRRADGGSIGGTVYGAGSSTSDSILTRLSVGEEVVRASSATTPGVRPLLKALNRDPVGTMTALTAPKGKTVQNTYNLGVVTQADPRVAFLDFQRRQNLLTQ